jgi:quercetin dioxygenase-like cupin family protein
MENIRTQGTARFSPHTHIVNVLDGAWHACLNEDGTAVSGIRGVEGVSALLESGLEMGVDRIEMMPGSSFEPHTHDGAHILFAVHGCGELQIGDETYVIGPGDTVFVPASVPHAVRTLAGGREPFSILAIGYPHKKVHARDRMRVVRRGKE